MDILKSAALNIERVKKSVQKHLFIHIYTTRKRLILIVFCKILFLEVFCHKGKLHVGQRKTLMFYTHIDLFQLFSTSY